MKRALNRSVVRLAAFAGLAGGVFAASVSACNADPGVDNLPGYQRPPSSNGADGGPGGPTLDGGGGSPDGTTAAVTVSSACADFAAARCKRDDACTGGIHNLVAYGDEPTCESRTTALCILQLSASGTAATPASMEACALSIPAQTCGNAFGEMPTPACLPATGPLTSGAACVASAQCASSYCAIAPDAVCGSCAPVPKAGDHCGSPEQCGGRGGLTCAGGVCIPIGQLGAACNGAIPCGFGLWCTSSTATSAGTCQPTSSDAGAACDPSGSPGCSAELGLTCDPVAKQCVPVTFAAAGKACGDLDGGVTQCAAGECVIAVPDGGGVVDAGVDAADAGDDAGDGSADAADAGTDAGVVDAAPSPSAPAVGMCVGAAKEGAACNTVSGPACLAPAACVVAGDGGGAGVCTLPNGTTCK